MDKVIPSVKHNMNKGEFTGQKVLLIDIETSPILASVWSLWKQNVGLSMIKEDWTILSFSAKWLHEEEIMYSDARNNIEDDYQLLKEVHGLLDEADIVIGHNGQRFDVPKINARLILNGFLPPSPFKVVDTLLMAKRTFKFTSNKLEYLTNKLCTIKKLSHAKFSGFSLWKECMDGNLEAWEEMKEYNIFDVLSLEELYLKMRAWDPRHPTMNVSQDNDNTLKCTKCSSTKLHKYGYYFTNKGKYQRHRCNDCGATSRSTFTENNREKRKSLLVSI